MSDIQHYNDIVNLISREVSDELSTDELLQLKAWVDECPENGLLYLRIKNSTNFKVRNIEYQKIDVPGGWKSVSNSIKKRRKLIIIKTIFKYAAVIFLPLLIALGIYYSSNLTNQNETIAQVTKILPGSTKAILILNDG